VHDRAVAVEITDGGSLLSAMGVPAPALTMIALRWQTNRVQD